MKKVIIVIVAAFFLISCKKNFVSSNNADDSILGKWSIISDSNYKGIGPANHVLNYTGQAGDYFDFRNDSVIYIKEGPVLDTLSYHLTSIKTIIISSFGIILNGVPATCQITELTDKRLTITAPNVITPGGVFGRSVRLSR